MGSNGAWKRGSEKFCVEETEAGKYKGEGSGMVQSVAGDCEDEMSE